ncbi:MAG: hypothetical protein COT81_04765 [Candidatus Buchananbacteria bacterium CG10_big_fil_rev_8_21_14_0_10_42_9]|uniref:Aminoacyl-transfer RNA synthetases class-II family profile domain-containing protein n=1 Tax=Candidatus Buchananbacteria bacterium CG10_big_fil_rev_8_21_14_0_10_42_9 TaxID=1974526 RepID=A0A2H0W077_9BACT|nr:MAG: hypothetical protein COT81_04765 [Candidatus Buchananbacteria bacterium CG10_big_fil_rev_8_21_14_0_10_42_9]
MNSTIKKLQLAGFDYSNGQVLLSGPALEIFDQWSDFFRNLAPEALNFKPAVTVNRDVLSTSQYFKLFPKQLTSCRDKSPHGGDMYFSPAACLHVYNFLRSNSLAKRNNTYVINAACARQEPQGHDPFRLKFFTMSEIVYIGEENSVRREVESAKGKLTGAFKRFGLKGEWHAGEDSFYLGMARGEKILQQLKELKKEYRWSVGRREAALASTNLHEDYFGKCFKIKTNSGNNVYSACIALGLERIVAASLITSGKR